MDRYRNSVLKEGDHLDYLGWMGVILRLHLEKLGYAVAQVFEVLRYKPEGRGFDSRWCHWNFSLAFRPHYGPGVDSVSNENDYQKYFLGVKAAGA